MLTTVLFDLDGTLLPMDQEKFLKLYLECLSDTFKVHVDPRRMTQSIMSACMDMIGDTGMNRTCCEKFVGLFEARVGVSWEMLEPMIDGFYSTEFMNIRTHFPAHADIPGLIKALKAKGYRLCVATNPVFPLVAILKRIEWAGLDAQDFELITDYKRMHVTKPHCAYYQEILDSLGVEAGECLMVGNDISDDLIATDAMGMQTFYLNECAIESAPLPQNTHVGDMDALRAFVEALPPVPGAQR